jgi:hypothetical protein
MNGRITIADFQDDSDFGFDERQQAELTIGFHRASNHQLHRTERKKRKTKA